MTSSVRPSLNALRAFETTARLKSMTLAAEELCVTHGAISRQIKSLETTLGVSLVARSGNATAPTPDGMALAEGLSAAFSLMYSTIERVKPGPLTLSCSASTIMCWLIPRLASLQELAPGIEIKLDMNYDKVDFIRDKVSVAIRNSTIEPPRDALIRELGTEWIGPVCSPQYLQTMGLAHISDLARATALTTNTRPHAWGDWFNATGKDPVELSQRRVFDHFYLLVQAAACGLGIAVVPHMLVMNELQSERLVAPFGFVPGPRQLSLWIAPHLGNRPDVKMLETWLIREMRDHIPKK